MTLYKEHFSIKDLENFSGIKAHTIRIWEKRYQLFSPSRTDTNIRLYNLDDLKAILNISYLNKYGFKISSIASLSPEQLHQLVKDTSQKYNDETEIFNPIKLAILSFDEIALETIISKVYSRHGFNYIVEEIFIPVLREIGILWQANAICPAQEHFISGFIRGKLYAAIDKCPLLPDNPENPVYCLFLPENEIHELGLLYIHYLIKSSGKKSIYLGQSVPMEDLLEIHEIYGSRLNYISIMTTNPAPDEATEYLNKLYQKFSKRKAHFIFSGQIIEKVPPSKFENFTFYPGFTSLVKAVKNQ
ncbi:MAG: MerR family transcriptional regulator [Cytophagaceae bacterium]